MRAPTMRVRVGALALVSVCGLAAPDYLSSAQHLRPPFHKALIHLSDKNIELKRASLSALKVLYEAAGQTFVQQVP